MGTQAICESCGVAYSLNRYRATRYCSRACKAQGEALRRDYPEPPVIPGARFLQLGRGRFALVDDHDYADVEAHRWRTNARGYVVTGGRRPTYLHRMILGAERELVDHANGDKLDNRRSNLRLADDLQNCANTIKRGVASPYKGVTSCKGTTKWRARIVVDGRETMLGYFVAADDAARAYDEAARARYGEFACVNFPRTGERSAVA